MKGRQLIHSASITKARITHLSRQSDLPAVLPHPCQRPQLHLKVNGLHGSSCRDGRRGFVPKRWQGPVVTNSDKDSKFDAQLVVKVRPI